MPYEVKMAASSNGGSKMTADSKQDYPKASGTKTTSKISLSEDTMTLVRGVFS